MTVCIAAMAEKGCALVLCADRQRTQGDMRHQGRLPKKREIGYGWCFLYEDNGTRADEFRDEIQDRLNLNYGYLLWPAQQEREALMTEREIVADIRSVFIELRDKTIKTGVLGLDETKLDLGLLVVGFDQNLEAAGYRIFDTGDYESIREVGYGVLGSGEDVANAALAQLGITMDDPLDHVLYNVYEAKRRADKIIVSVGSPTDLWIMTDKLRLQTQRVVKHEDNAVVVPPRILQVLSEVFEWRSAPPWSVSSEPRSGYWRSELADYCGAVMRGERPA